MTIEKEDVKNKKYLKAIYDKQRVPKKPNESAFYERVIPVTESGCWLWVGKVSNVRCGGYGVYNGYTMHRFSYELHNGDIPKGLCVCHKCDVPSCVNPSHLFLGTHKENMKDMQDKGRKWSGIVMRKIDGLPASAKLTPSIVKEIKNLLTDGMSQNQIAKIYGVTQSTISFIKRGATWQNV
jgi:hypothetical protein